MLDQWGDPAPYSVEEDDPVNRHLIYELRKTARRRLAEWAETRMASYEFAHAFPRSGDPI